MRFYRPSFNPFFNLNTNVTWLCVRLKQKLDDDLRIHYSKMWLAMINADVEGMKRHAEALNVGHLFGLFACMLTARSWKALQAGIGKHEFTDIEVGMAHERDSPFNAVLIPVNMDKYFTCFGKVFMQPLCKSFPRLGQRFVCVGRVKNVFKGENALE